MNFLKVFFYIFLVFKYECLSVRKNKNIDIQGLFDALTLMTKMLNADRNILKTVLPNQSVQTCGMSCPKNSSYLKIDSKKGENNLIYNFFVQVHLKNYQIQEVTLTAVARITLRSILVFLTQLNLTNAVIFTILVMKTVQRQKISAIFNSVIASSITVLVGEKSSNGEEETHSVEIQIIFISDTHFLKIFFLILDCKGVVKILVGAVNNFGCAAYKAGQLLACQCDGA